MKDQIVDVSGFLVQAGAVAAAQLCHCSAEASWDTLWRGGRGVPVPLHWQKQVRAAFGLFSVVCWLLFCPSHTRSARDVFILAQWLSWAKEKFGEGQVIWISVCARRVSKIISPAVFTWKSKSVKGAWIINLYPVSALQVSGNWCSIYLRLHLCVCIRCIHGADLAP